MSAGVGLLAKAVTITGDDCIGLHIAEHADLQAVDVHYYAMLASATLSDVRATAFSDCVAQGFSPAFPQP